LAPRDGTVGSILIAFGSDTGEATAIALEATRGLDLPVTAVLGDAAPAYERVAAAARDRAGVTLLSYADAMAELLLRHDLAIGAGGVSALERAYLGVPAVVWPIAENQREVVDGLVRAGAALAVPEPVTVGSARAALATLTASAPAVRALSEGALAMMAARDRSVEEMLAFVRASGAVRA
jgi:spore coat polysaccharide biosynthesis predicted glycosyltransferase SpsG